MDSLQLMTSYRIRCLQYTHFFTLDLCAVKVCLKLPRASDADYMSSPSRYCCGMFYASHGVRHSPKCTENPQKQTEQPKQIMTGKISVTIIITAVTALE